MYFASGDLDFLWDEQIDLFSWLPNVWQSDKGLGFHSITSLWLDYPFRLFVKLLYSAGLPWIMIDKVLWFGMFGLAILSSYTLARFILRKDARPIISSIIYTFNTYILLLFSGGQLGVALAYSFFPLVLTRFLTSIEHSDRGIENRLREIIKNSLVFGILIMLDIRFAYMFAGLIVVYVFFHKNSIQILIHFVVSMLLSVFYHLYWIFPIVLGEKTTTISSHIVETGMVKFLSFADLPHTLGLLHPNWPENFFGKIYFMQPEFLFLPLVAFTSLFFLSKKKQKSELNIFQFRNLIFFAVFSLVGIFLTKGMNEPFGFIYSWFFETIPGFVMFRDPTKFYTFITLSYSILIPFVLEQLLRELSHKTFKWFKSRNGVILLYGIFFCIWFFTLRSVFTGEVKGNFRVFAVDGDSLKLKNLLVNDSNPSRVLWIPKKEIFSFSSNTHPLLISNQIFPAISLEDISLEILHPDFFKKLHDFGIGYIVVPVDLEKRIFLDNYEYDVRLRQKILQAFDDVKLDKVQGFENLAVYAIKGTSFTQNIPSFVHSQNEWAKRGLYLSLLFISFALIFSTKLPLKQNDSH